ncbi:penicillin-binding protein [Patescibacteria group bacterium]|nr:penicillin-binding protein [Patescibacteria group bacterium]MCL5010371.1 penicillin-binding protein [Patescibacteria group bacterium]
MFRRRRRRSIRLGSSNIFLLSRLAKYCFFATVGLIFLAVILFAWYGRDLPTPGKLVYAKTAESTRIYDRNGVLLYSVYKNENRIYVPLSQIPKSLQEATIAVEDKNFYKNEGFSITGYLRAIRNMILFRSLSGGSTLTQQLVKNTLLTPERTIPRKIKELILSIQVDKKYTKNQILEMYLNDIPYGGAAVGVEAGAQMYFGKDVKDLDLAQSAFLAGLPQSPSVYSPFSGHKYYIDRTNEVLTRMADSGYISSQQAEAALSEIKNTQFNQNDTSIKAPHFVMYVKSLLAKEFGEAMVDNGGLQVTTTLDWNIEKEAEKIVKTQIGKLKIYHATNGAAVVTDPKTGEILSMVGSEDYFDTKNDGNFNAALAHRQPGSSLKPIMYAVAFEKGYTPATMVMDVKTDFPTGDPAHPMYTPVNYDRKYHGPMQLRFALGNSINVIAVKMLARVGIKNVMEKAYEMGIKNWQPTSSNMKDVGLSLVLGGRETTLLSETTAYGVFASGGYRHDPVAILKVTDKNGNVLYQYHPTQGQRVLPEDVCFLISHILLDNNARSMEFGPNSWLRIPGKTVSVKTGTTDEKRDNWTIGYTPSYVVGVWVGNNDNSPMNQAIASGITGASPIWHDIMSSILKGKPDQPPKKPNDVIAMQIDALGGGLPVPNEPTRSEYFIKGTEPTSPSPIYQKIKISNHEHGKLANPAEIAHGDYHTKDYIVFHEDDPVSADGVNRWQEGIDAWVKESHSAADWQYYPPTETSDYKY